MNMVPQEPMSGDLEGVRERAERGRAFYFMFPGSRASDRWLQDFGHADTAAGAKQPTGRGPVTGRANETEPRR